MRALLTGITGQDGSYLAEYLLARKYEVHGIIRRSSSINTARLDHIYADPHEPGARLHLHYGDLADASSIARALRIAHPDEVYLLGAQSHVRVSFDMPEYTADVGAMGTLRALEAVNEYQNAHVRPGAEKVRVYVASSSEMFGSSPPPQNESTAFHPRSPYATAKVFAHHTAVNWRERGMHVSCGILFNHTGPRRGETFVERKITIAAGRIAAGKQDKLFLGNLDAQRDWGWAPDYVEAMWKMLQVDADDFVVATGEMHTVREVLDVAFGYHDLDWKKYVEIDPKYFRPTEVDALCGDASKARRVLGWAPTKTFREIVLAMAEADSLAR